MENYDLDGKIAVKNKEIQVETDPNKKARFQRELEILNLRKQIESLKNKIEFKKKNL